MPERRRPPIALHLRARPHRRWTARACLQDAFRSLLLRNSCPHNPSFVRRVCEVCSALLPFLDQALTQRAVRTGLEFRWGLRPSCAMWTLPVTSMIFRPSVNRSPDIRPARRKQGADMHLPTETSFQTGGRSRISSCIGSFDRSARDWGVEQV